MKPVNAALMSFCWMSRAFCSLPWYAAHWHRGQTPILDCSARHDRISVISAITLSPKTLRVGLHFMLLANNQNFHAEEVVLFLQQLKGEVSGHLTIVWDRSKIHKKSLVVRAWLEEHPGVEVEDFPAYAPKTNPDESVWCWTKYGQLCNLAPADVAELHPTFGTL